MKRVVEDFKIVPRRGPIMETTQQQWTLQHPIAFPSKVAFSWIIWPTSTVQIHNSHSGLKSLKPPKISQLLYPKKPSLTPLLGFDWYPLNQIFRYSPDWFLRDWRELMSTPCFWFLGTFRFLLLGKSFCFLSMACTLLIDCIFGNSGLGLRRCGRPWNWGVFSTSCLLSSTHWLVTYSLNLFFSVLLLYCFKLGVDLVQLIGWAAKLMCLLEFWGSFKFFLFWGWLIFLSAVLLGWWLVLLCLIW